MLKIIGTVGVIAIFVNEVTNGKLMGSIIRNLKFKKEMRKGIKEGVIEKIDGKYYEVGTTW